MDTMFTSLQLALWSFKIVLCNKDCDLKLCKDLSDYIKNADDCRGTAAVYRSYTQVLSMIPLPAAGISKIYSGNYFDAVFEILEDVIALLSICHCCCLCDTRNVDDDPLLACGAFWSFLLAVINVVRYVICQALTESYQLSYELSLMITSLAISLVFCCCGCANNRCWIASLILNVIAVGLMEMIRDFYMATYSDTDGNGCPFV